MAARCLVTEVRGCRPGGVAWPVPAATNEIPAPPEKVRRGGRRRRGAAITVCARVDSRGQDGQDCQFRSTEPASGSAPRFHISKPSRSSSHNPSVAGASPVRPSFCLPRMPSLRARTAFVRNDAPSVECGTEWRVHPQHAPHFSSVSTGSVFIDESSITDYSRSQSEPWAACADGGQTRILRFSAPGRPMSMPYTLHRVPVRGGYLAVGEWCPEDDTVSLTAPTIVALHGATGTHLAWSFLAEASPRSRILAPDLRGRGGSRHLPGPYGLTTHVEDVAAVVEWFGLDGAFAVGHSLGAFVATLAQSAGEDVFDALLLVDGGLPLAVPLAASTAEHASAVFGRGAGASLVFGSREEHQAFWRQHPGTAGVWTPLHAACADYESVDDGGRVRWAGDSDALAQDLRELHGVARFRAALDSIAVPTTIIAARRGLFNEDDGLYSDRQLAHARKEWPQIRFITTEHNHYLSVLSHEGGRDIAEQLDVLSTTVELCRTGWARNTRDVRA